MANSILNFTNALLDSANTISNVMDDYTTNEAKRSTQNKQIQLKKDIQDKMMEIQRSSSSDEWQTKIDGYFQNVKSSMSDKNSPYYCKNNLQAEMFDSILSETQVSVNGEVQQLVFKADRQHALVEYQNTLETLAQTETPENQLRLGNEAARNLYDCGYIDEDQLQQQYNNNFDQCYINTGKKFFDNTVEGAIKRGDSAQTVIDMVFKNMPELTSTDTAGLPKMRDTTQLRDTLTKYMEQNYSAKLADIQNANAGKLSEIVQEMRRQETAQGKLSVARKGFMEMDKMTGNMLTNSQRDHYSDIFEFIINSSGSGSGSGGLKKSDFESFEKFMKAEPEIMVQLVKDGTIGNYYDGVKLGALTLQDEWFNGNYQENYDKDAAERNETYNLVYKASTSEETLSTRIFDLLLENYPTAKDLVKNDYNKLITDIQKNPDKYGTATVGALSEWMMDTLLGADKNYTDDDFAKDFKDHLNDCYAESIDYVVLDKKGNLVQKFNAKLPADIAKAARFAQEKDYVYTVNGAERWAEGKKEALEAEGGIVDVLKNAVAGTLGLTEDDIKNNPIGFYYKPDAAHDDLTSTPIITYKGKGYEVIPDEGDKGFKLRVINPGAETIEKDGKLYEVIRHDNGYERIKEVEYIDGKTGVKEFKFQRDQEKKEAKAQEKAAAENVATIRKEREEASDKSIMETKSTPTAVVKSNKLDYEDEWNHANDLESKKAILRRVVNRIQNDADNVNSGKKGGISKTEFKNKYNIDYDEWIKDKEETRRFDLILKS